MGIIVRELKENEGQLFTSYLEGLDYGHSPHWATCYCRYYHLTGPMSEWQARSGEVNRNDALESIACGKMKGYLAFDGDKCIGWCNANDLAAYPRIADEVAPYLKPGMERVGATVCFVIHPDYRGKGVARIILEKLVKDHMDKGYSAMVALPFESIEQPQKRYRGTRRMYEELGYEAVGEDGDVCIMLKSI